MEAKRKEKCYMRAELRRSEEAERLTRIALHEVSLARVGPRVRHLDAAARVHAPTGGAVHRALGPLVIAVARANGHVAARVAAPSLQSELPLDLAR